MDVLGLGDAFGKTYVRRMFGRWLANGACNAISLVFRTIHLDFTGDHNATALKSRSIDRHLRVEHPAAERIGLLLFLFLFHLHQAFADVHPGTVMPGPRFIRM